MNTIEKLNTIRQRVLNAAASVNEYKDHWGTDFSFKELAAGLSPNKCFGWEAIPLVTEDELKSLNRETLYGYGFGNWDGKLLLIPLWLVKFMDGQMEVTSIMGDKSTLTECDKDVRGGCIAWGFYTAAQLE